MKTAEKVAEHWVVDVEDVRDLELNKPGYHKRFKFSGADAAIHAWTCAQSAEAHGFKVKTERVKR